MLFPCRISILCSLTLLLISSHSPAATGPGADLVRDGKVARSFNTIQPAIDAAQPGDTVRIRPGVYHEILLISGREGTAGRPIIVEAAAPGTVTIDGADPGLQKAPNKRWESLGDNTWKATVPWNSADPAIAQLTWVTPETGPILAAYHKPEKFAELKRGPGTIRAGTELKIKFPDVTDPNTLAFSAGLSEAVILLKDSSYWTIRNLEIVHGGNINLSIQDNCHYIVVDNVTAHDAWQGISTDSVPSKNKIDHITVTHCTVTNRWNRAWPWIEGYADGEKASDDSNAPVRGTAIHVKANDSEVAFNTVDGIWDGLEIQGNNVLVHDNTIHNCHDDGVELESAQSANVRFYNNLIYDVHVGISLVSEQPGPIYVYRNRVSCNRLNPEDPDKGKAFRFGYPLKMGHDWGPGAQKVYIYHNSLYGKWLTLWDKETTPWKDFQFLDNIFISEGLKDLSGATDKHWIWNTGLASNGCLWNGNIYFRPGNTGVVFRKWNGTDEVATLDDARKLYPGWEVNGMQADPGLVQLNTDVNAANDFAIKADSPARDHAVPLPDGWPDSVTAADGKPDIGAVEYTAPVASAAAH